MDTITDEPLADDLVLGVWAAIALFGSARRCPDRANETVLVAKAELILSAVIPHLARRALVGPRGEAPDRVH